MKKFRFTFFISAFLFLSVSCSTKAAFKLSVPQTQLSEEADLVQNKSGSLKYFLFSKEHCVAIEEFVRNKGTGSLLIQISVNSPYKKALPYSDQFGFLYEKDLVSSSRISSNLQTRPLVSMDFKDFAKETVAVLFSFSKDNPLPVGFYINSKGRYKILSAEISESSVGFDFTKEVPLYAFAPNGGAAVKNSKKSDLSGLSLCFPAHNSETSVLPVINFSFTESETQSPVKFVIGGERITIRNGGAEVLPVPVASLKNPYSVLEITENSEQISSVLVKSGDKDLLKTSSLFKRSPVKPIKIDPGLIMNWPQANWRGNDYELFEWDRFSGILFFDIADYKIQDEFFRRLAYFVEKQGYRGRLLSDAELEGKHGYNAHDYKAEDLARFFQKASKTGFKLNSRELLLREILLENGVIVQENGVYSGGRGAVISVSQESPMYLRTTFVAHEGWHGIYFVDEDFRNLTAGIFYSLKAADPGTLNFLIRYFQVTPTLNYDTTDDYLLKNEFMAYMLQRPVSAVEKYYTDMASREHAQYMMKAEADYLLSTKAEGFVGCSQMFEDYVMSRWNLAAGRVWLLSR